MIYLRSRFHVLRLNGSLVNNIKLEANRKARKPSVLLFIIIEIAFIQDASCQPHPKFRIRDIINVLRKLKEIPRRC
jgi:hypothetical protein